MKTITYTNKQGLKINKFASGAFSLTFNNGVHTFCRTVTELRNVLLENGMTRKWADFIKKYRTKMEVLHSFRGSFVHMVGTELEMRYMDAGTLARKITRYGFKQF